MEEHDRFIFVKWFYCESVRESQWKGKFSKKGVVLKVNGTKSTSHKNVSAIILKVRKQLHLICIKLAFDGKFLAGHLSLVCYIAVIVQDYMGVLNLHLLT